MEKPEDRLQYEIVTLFGQKYPQYRNNLIEINNDTYSINHAMKRKSMGMVGGASDLLFINPNSAVCLFIELKAQNTTHKTLHIQKQLSFLADMGKAGHYTILTTDKDFVLEFIYSLIKLNSDYASFLEEANKLYLREKIISQFSKKSVNF